jgi:hypothetical protein
MSRRDEDALSEVDAVTGSPRLHGSLVNINRVIQKAITLCLRVRRGSANAEHHEEDADLTAETQIMTP